MTFAKGLSAFPITPMNANGRVDTPALQRLVAPLAAAKVDSIGLLGSTGSYPFLTRDERRRAADAAIARVGDTAAILAHERRGTAARTSHQQQRQQRRPPARFPHAHSARP